MPQGHHGQVMNGYVKQCSKGQLIGTNEVVYTIIAVGEGRGGYKMRRGKSLPSINTGSIKLYHTLCVKSVTKTKKSCVHHIHVVRCTYH